MVIPTAGSRNQSGKLSSEATYVNRAIAARPSQYAGEAASTTEIMVSVKSVYVPRRAPCTMPIIVPTRNESSSDAPPSASEMGSASRSTATTGRPSLKLVPRSPCSIRPVHRTYCAVIGWSSPSVARRRTASAPDALGGSRKVAGSPGAMRRSTNVSDSTHQYSTAVRTSAPEMLTERDTAGESMR